MIVKAPKTRLLSLKHAASHISGTGDGKMYATALDSDIAIYGSKLNLTRTLYGHLLDVTCTKFFLSNQVLLSGSLDMQIKIWNIIDGTCVRTLKGHTRAVMDLEIIGVGTNVLSGSMDGTVRLW